MRLRQVNLSTIVVPEVRVTARFDAEKWEEFKSSIKELGALSPIICCEMTPGELETEGEGGKVEERCIQPNGKVLVLVDGLHRLVEMRNNGVEKGDVAVFEGSMVEVLVRNLMLDRLRGKTPPSEMIAVVDALYKEYKVDIDEISARIGRPRDWVERLLKLGELTPMCRAAIDEERIGLGQAYELTRLTDPVAQETVLHQIELYHWTIKEVHDQVSEVIRLSGGGEPAPSPAAQPEPYRPICRFCGLDYDFHEIANPNICTGCAGILYAAIAQARAEAAAAQPPPNESGGV